MRSRSGSCRRYSALAVPSKEGRHCRCFFDWYGHSCLRLLRVVRPFLLEASSSGTAIPLSGTAGAPYLLITAFPAYALFLLFYPFTLLPLISPLFTFLPFYFFTFIRFFTLHSSLFSFFTFLPFYLYLMSSMLYGVSWYT